MSPASNTISQNYIDNSILISDRFSEIPEIKVGAVLFDEFIVLKQIQDERVFLVADKNNTSKIYALKICNREKIFTDRYNLRREYIHHSEFLSPHIVRLFDAYEDKNYFAFLMEFVGGGNLSLYKAKDERLFEFVIKVLKDVALGLKVIHEKSFIHGDIKPENLLVSSNGNIKLTDFGLSRNIKYETVPDSETKGTLQYLCPHYLTTGILTPTSDIFSLGVIAYEMIVGTIPHMHEDIIRLLQYRVYEESPFVSDIVKNCPVSLSLIIKKCLEINPNSRYLNIDNLLSDILVYQKAAVKNVQTSKIKLFSDFPTFSSKKRKTSIFKVPKAA